MKIAIASDHAGFELKTALIAHFKEKYQFIDCGTQSTENVDAFDYARKGVYEIKDRQASLGIFICGTGVGMSITANRFSFIRAALCRSEEEARLSREHNDANVLCLGGRISNIEDSIKMVDIFLTTAFSGKERYVRRIEKTNKCFSD